MGVSHRRVKGLLIDGYRLTTAEILYHFPDYPSLLQQRFPLAPTSLLACGSFGYTDH